MTRVIRVSDHAVRVLSLVDVRTKAVHDERDLGAETFDGDTVELERKMLSKLGKHHAGADVLGSADDQDDPRLVLDGDGPGSDTVAVPEGAQIITLEGDLLRSNCIVESLCTVSGPHRNLDCCAGVVGGRRVDVNGRDLA